MLSVPKDQPAADRSSDELSRPPTPLRRASESSTSLSTYSTALPSTSPTTTLSLYNTSSHLDLRIHPGSAATTPALYNVHNSCFPPSSPDVTLLSASSQILGVVHLSIFRSVLKVCVGDPAAKNPIWEDVERKSRTKREYAWSWAGDGGERREYIWRRTRHGLDGNEAGGDGGGEKEKGKEKGGKVHYGSWKLLDVATGEVVALFAHNGIRSWKKMGRMQIRKRGGEGEN